MAAPQKTQGFTTTRERTPAASSTAGGGTTREKIAARAYEIWQESGRPEGKDLENWYRAERELRARAAPSN